MPKKLVFLMAYKSISASTALVDLKESGRMASTNAAGVAAANAAKLGAAGADGHVTSMLSDSNMTFYINK